MRARAIADWRNVMWRFRMYSPLGVSECLAKARDFRGDFREQYHNRRALSSWGNSLDPQESTKLWVNYGEVKQGQP